VITNNAITPSWSETSPFTRTAATEEEAGSVKGVIVLTLGATTANVDVDLVIPALPPTLKPGDLVWAPNLAGATSTGTGRNPVYDANGNGLGLITSSSADGVISITTSGSLSFVNTHTSNHLRLQSVIAGSNANSAVDYGFLPIAGATYRIVVNASTAEGENTPPAALSFFSTAIGNQSTVIAAPGTTRFEHIFTYNFPIASDPNGNIAFGINTMLASGEGPLYFSDIRVYYEGIFDTLTSPTTSLAPISLRRLGQESAFPHLHRFYCIM
jgi:hypothetical protein